MAFRSISTNDTFASPLTITAPSGIVAGDVLVAWAVNDVVASTFTWPAGFSDVPGTPLTDTADGQTLGVAIKIAGGSEPGSYDISVSANTIIGGIAAFSGLSSTQPHQASVGTSNVANASPWAMTTAAFSSSTTVVCDTVVVGGSDVTTSVDVVHSGPTGYTVRADIPPGTGFRQTALSSKDGVAAGESGALTMTGTFGGASAGWCVVALALGVQTESPISSFAARAVQSALRW